MVFYLKLVSVLMVTLLLASVAASKSMGQPERSVYPHELDIAEDDGSMDNALMNYLFARQMVNRMRQNMDVQDLQKKRSYWKQCAFNAVSCFGKKK